MSDDDDEPIIAHWPGDWPGRRFVDLDCVGDPGDWIDLQISSAQEILFDDPDDDAMASAFAVAYIDAGRELGFPLPSYSGMSDNEMHETAVEDFLGFLREWRKRTLAERELLGIAPTTQIAVNPHRATETQRLAHLSERNPSTTDEPTNVGEESVATPAFPDASGKPRDASDTEQISLPKDRIVALSAVAKTYIAYGIDTPAAVARELDETFDGKARKYSQSFWDIIGSAKPALRGTHDWAAIYAALNTPVAAAPQATNPGELIPFDQLPLNLSGEVQTQSPSTIASFLQAEAIDTFKGLVSIPSDDYYATHPATNANVRILAAHHRSTNMLASAAATEQVELPPDRLLKFASLAQMYIADGIDTPGALAREFDRLFDGKARKFSQAFWDMMGSAKRSLRGEHDWAALYAALDNPVYSAPTPAKAGNAPLSVSQLNQHQPNIAHAFRPAALSPAEHARRMGQPTPDAELKKQIATLNQALGEARQQKTRADILNTALAERMKRIEAEFAKMGITLDDVFAGDAYLRLRGQRIDNNVFDAANYSKIKRNALTGIKKGWSNDAIAKKTGLTAAQVQVFHDDHEAAYVERMMKLGDAALSVDNLDVGLASYPTTHVGIIPPR